MARAYSEIQEGLLGPFDCRLADASCADAMPAAKSLLQAVLYGEGKGSIH